MIKVSFRFIAVFIFAAAATIALAQPSGTLSGRIVYTSGGHGWTNRVPNVWQLQRPLAQEMLEDYGNYDQATLFTEYCFNAGATVVPLRPIGHQTNEVVLDNLSAGVSFAGPWTHRTAEPVYFGSVGSGFQQATSGETETAVATYTPQIPVTGFYPVYTWVPHGSNRTNQLYRIRHTGGESLVRIPHHMVGNGWVYLGSYYFNAGSNEAVGSVVISNEQPGTDESTVVIADAIRFGNGMSNSGSGQPREDEGARLWIQYASMGQGQSPDIYTMPTNAPGDADRRSRPLMVREMNREQAGSATKRVYLSFHSNAHDGTARGGLALYHSTDKTPNQVRFAELVGTEINVDMARMAPQMETVWAPRPTVSLGGVYYEIENTLIGGEMDATIAEVAFHDNVFDARIMRDPKARTWIGRSAYHAIVKYMNEFDGAPLNFLPEPPTNVRADGTAEGISVSWTPTAANISVGWGAPAGYLVYVSTNGYGFGSPTATFGGTATNLVLTNLVADTDYYFRITATNSGGESLPSEVVGCRRSSNPAAPKVLFVNANTRLDRHSNLRQLASVSNWRPPGNTTNASSFERVVPRWNNSFDYVVQHGKAMSDFGVPFDSCHRDAVASGLMALTNYLVVVWAGGEENRTNFNSTLQTRVTQFLSNGGHLFVSGAEIARELTRAPMGSADRNFLNNILRANLTQESHTNSGIYAVTPQSNSIFSGNPSIAIDDGTKGIYWVRTPEVLTPYGIGTSTALTYAGSTSGAAGLQFDGDSVRGRLVYLGFPFETIAGEAVREEYMSDILHFLGRPFISRQPASMSVAKGSNFVLSVEAQGWNGLSYQWRKNGVDLAAASTASLTRVDAEEEDSGSYTVVISNASGSVTSAVASVMVAIPPTIVMQPQGTIASVGAVATFTVEAMGTAPLNYRWFFEGSEIAGAGNASLSVTNVQFTDAGSYSVLVSNAVGVVSSATAPLTVTEGEGEFTPGMVGADRLHLAFSGEAGESYAIQFSTNLVHWSTLTNITLGEGSFLLEETATSDQKFYRSLRQQATDRH